MERKVAAFVAGILLCAAAPAYAQLLPPAVTTVAQVGYGMASSFDTLFTAVASQRSTAHEANPLYRWIEQRTNTIAAMTVKGGIATGAVLWVQHDKQQHPTRAQWTALGLFAGQIVVDIINVKKTREFEVSIGVPLTF